MQRRLVWLLVIWRLWFCSLSSLPRLVLSFVVVRVRGLWWWAVVTSVRMSPPQMLLKVLSPRKSFASASNAVGMRAIKRSSCWPYAFLVHFSHVSKQTATIGESRILLTRWFVTFIRPLMLVHVLVPFTWTAEGLVLITAGFMLAYNLAIVIARWFSFRACRICLDGVARRWYVRMWCHHCKCRTVHDYLRKLFQDEVEGGVKNVRKQSRTKIRYL